MMHPQLPPASANTGALPPDGLPVPGAQSHRVVPLTEVAEGTGIHRATLSKVLNQPGTNVGTDIIDKLCRYFRCQPGDLLMYMDEPPVG